MSEYRGKAMVQFHSLGIPKPDYPHLMWWGRYELGLVSPGIYLHSGWDVQDTLAKTEYAMGSRKWDVLYSAARFVGYYHEANPGVTGLGFTRHRGLLTTTQNPGAQGVFLVDCTKEPWEMLRFGARGHILPERLGELLEREKTGMAWVDETIARLHEAKRL